MPDDTPFDSEVFDFGVFDVEIPGRLIEIEASPTDYATDVLIAAS